MGIFSLIIGLILFLFVNTVIFVILLLIITRFFKNSYINKLKTGKREIYITIFSFFLTLSTFIVIAVISNWNSNDYWKANDWVEYDRVPLEYPYQLVMLEGPDVGTINLWKDSSNAIDVHISGIDSINKYNNFVFGFSDGNDHWDKINQIDNPDVWFIFDCKAGKSYIYSSEKICREKLDSLQIDKNISFISIKGYYDKYWDEH